MIGDKVLVGGGGDLELILKQSFSAYYLLFLLITSFFKDKKSKRGHKTIGIVVFLPFFP